MPRTEEAETSFTRKGLRQVFGQQLFTSPSQTRPTLKSSKSAPFFFDIFPVEKLNIQNIENFRLNFPPMNRATA
jgi:hypothetical protein